VPHRFRGPHSIRSPSPRSRSCRQAPRARRREYARRDAVRDVAEKGHPSSSGYGCSLPCKRFASTRLRGERLWASPRVAPWFGLLSCQTVAHWGGAAPRSSPARAPERCASPARCSRGGSLGCRRTPGLARRRRFQETGAVPMGVRPGPHDLASHLDLVYLHQIRLDEILVPPHRSYARAALKKSGLQWIAFNRDERFVQSEVKDL
jgi:hypothetical protein